MRGRLHDGQRFLALCICAGVLCGLVGVSFHLAITLLFDGLFGVYRTWGVWTLPAMILSPALAGLIVGLLIQKVAPTAAGSGIPQTKAAYHNKFGIVKTSEAFWRFIAGTISVGFGNSLGREGPTVHICSAVSSKLGRLFGLSKQRTQAMIPVGMGAGISAAFNAPLAAITFVFEELFDNNFSSKALGGILVAVVVAAVVERSILGEHSALGATREAFETSWWMLICLVIGPCAGLLGHVFTSLLLYLRARFKQWKRMPPYLQPALGGLAVGLIGATVWQFSNGHHGVFSIGYADLNSALNGQLLWQALLLLLIGKFLATAVCYASGASGGIFAPVLFIGSMLGGLLGVLMVRFFDLDPGIAAATALLGTGAFFAAVIRCPLTSILIIFEMTHNYSLILPLMIGNLIAYLIASKLRSIPIYDALLLQDGVSLKKMPAYRGDRDWRNLPISTIMTHDCLSVFGERNAPANLQRIANKGQKHHGYPVVSEHNPLELLGMVTHHELDELQKNGDSNDLNEWLQGRGIIRVYPDDSIRDVANQLVIKDVLQAPVVSRKNPTKLLGIVTLHDIARQQNAIEDNLD